MSVSLTNNSAPLHPDKDAALLLRSMPDLVRSPGQELSPLRIALAYMYRTPAITFAPPPAKKEPAITITVASAASASANADAETATLCTKLANTHLANTHLAPPTDELSPLISPIMSPIASAEPTALTLLNFEEEMASATLSGAPQPTAPVSTIAAAPVLSMTTSNYEEQLTAAKTFSAASQPDASAPTAATAVVKELSPSEGQTVTTTATPNAVPPVIQRSESTGIALPILDIHTVQKVSCFSETVLLKWHLGQLSLDFPKKRFFPKTEQIRAAENEKLMKKLSKIEDFLRNNIHFYPVPGHGNTIKYANARALGQLVSWIKGQLDKASQAFGKQHDVAVDAIIQSIERLTQQIDKQHETHLQRQIQQLNRKLTSGSTNNESAKDDFQKKWDAAGKRNAAAASATAAVNSPSEEKKPEKDANPLDDLIFE